MMNGILVHYDLSDKNKLTWLIDLAKDEVDQKIDFIGVQGTEEPFPIPMIAFITKPVTFSTYKYNAYLKLYTEREFTILEIIHSNNLPNGYPERQFFEDRDWGIMQEIIVSIFRQCVIENFV